MAKSGRAIPVRSRHWANDQDPKRDRASAVEILDALAVGRVYRPDWGRIPAALIHLVGDFEMAEESAQEAFAAAIDQWRVSGNPEFPRAWIIQTTRHKAIDRFHRFAHYRDSVVSQVAAPGRRGTSLRYGRNPRRPAEADLHLLSSPRWRSARWADHGRDRAGVSGAACHHGAAAGASQA